MSFERPGLYAAPLADFPRLIKESSDSRLALDNIAAELDMRAMRIPETFPAQLEEVEIPKGYVSGYREGLLLRDPSQAMDGNI